MYAFAQRTDTTVLDEPFYGFYLAHSGVLHPGREDVLEAQSADELTVKNQILNAHDSAVLFVKNMAHHMQLMEEPSIDDAINVFLIRNPKQILASYAQVIDKPVMRDIGIEYQYQLVRALQVEGEPFVVIDSGMLLENPAGVLSQLCHHCAIAFQEQMLHWPAGPKRYDGVWAEHWYANVHQSTGFAKQSTSIRPLPEHLNDLYQQARRYYEKLLPFSLKA